MRMDRRRYQLYGITDDYRGGKGPLRKMFEDIVIYDKLEFLTQHETFRLAVGGQLSVPIPGSHEGFYCPENRSSRRPSVNGGLRLFYFVRQSASGQTGGLRIRCTFYTEQSTFWYPRLHEAI